MANQTRSNPPRSAPPIVSLRGAAVVFGEPPLFEGLDVHLSRGERACLVGRNGCGKSTLMKAIIGELDLDAGERYLEPGIRIDYLEQEPRFPDGQTVAEHVAAGKQPRHLVEAILMRIELDGDRILNTLSGGEKRRAALARVFADPPDLLLLDEPTNHLDIGTIDWLEGALANYSGAALIVSHDRTFLSRVTNRILWLEKGRLRRSDQGFSFFESWCESILEEEANVAAKLDSKLELETRWLLRGVTARRKRNQGRLRKLDDMRQARASLLQNTGKITAKIEDGDLRSRQVIEAKNIAKAFTIGDVVKPILSDFSTRIMRGDRIGIIGPNGSGKTTLLRMLIGEDSPDKGSVRVGKALRHAYFDQHRSELKHDATLKSTLCPTGGDMVNVLGSHRNVRSYLKDWLFDPRAVNISVSALSGGERNRLLLSKILATPSDLLILDEPTNDLDMDTLDLLQELLSDYAGTLLVVSHDRDFLDRTVTSTIVLEGDGQAREYAGGYADYLEQSKERRKNISAQKKSPNGKGSGSAKPAAAGPGAVKPKTKLTYKDQRALEMLPGQIAEKEAEIVALEAELADADLFHRDPDRFTEAMKRLPEVQAELTDSEDKWLELEVLQDEIEQAKAG